MKIVIFSILAFVALAFAVVPPQKAVIVCRSLRPFPCCFYKLYSGARKRPTFEHVVLMDTLVEQSLKSVHLAWTRY